MGGHSGWVPGNIQKILAYWEQDFAWWLRHHAMIIAIVGRLGATSRRLRAAVKVAGWVPMCDTHDALHLQRGQLKGQTKEIRVGM